MRAPSGWRRRDAGKALFGPEEVDVLETTLDLLPELRACALAVREARRARVSYPIEDRRPLVQLLDRRVLEEAGFRIEPEDIVRFLPDEYLPIEHEGDLIGRVYVGLVRCREELSLATRAEPRALGQLRELRERSERAEE